MPVDSHNPTSVEAIFRRSEELEVSTDENAVDAELLAAIADGTICFDEIDEESLRRCMESFGPDAVIEAFYEAEYGARLNMEQVSRAAAGMDEAAPVKKPLHYLQNRFTVYGWSGNRAAWIGVAAAVLFLGAMIFGATSHQRAFEPSIAHLSPMPLPERDKSAQTPEHSDPAAKPAGEFGRAQPTIGGSEKPVNRSRPEAASPAAQPLDGPVKPDFQQGQAETPEVPKPPTTSGSAISPIKPSGAASATVTSDQQGLALKASKPDAASGGSAVSDQYATARTSIGGHSVTASNMSIARAPLPKPVGIVGRSVLHKRRIAVLDFGYASVRPDVQAIFETDQNVGKGISNLLTKQLLEGGAYVTPEGSSVDKIIREQGFSNRDRVDPATAATIGRLLNVDAVIVGDVTSFGNDENQGKRIAGLGIVHLGGPGLNKNKLSVEIEARVIDAGTGQILASVSGNGEVKRHGAVGAGARSTLVGNVDLVSSNFEDTQIGRAVTLAVTDLATNLENKAVSAQGRSAKWTTSPPVLSVGDSSSKVLEAYGMPMKIVDLGVKKLYFYKDLKVFFLNDKIIDVEPSLGER